MYHWDAEEYCTSSSNQKKWALELLSKLDLKGSERVLDIGCGDGEITAAIARRVPRGSAVGIDSSRDMVDLAATRYPPNRFPNISFVLKDAREIDFDQEFDAVFSNACLHWVVDHQARSRRHQKMPEALRQSAAANGWKGECSHGSRGNRRGLEDTTMGRILRGLHLSLCFLWAG